VSKKRTVSLRPLKKEIVSHFVIEVNRKKKLIKNGETLDVVRGDLIR